MKGRSGGDTLPVEMYPLKHARILKRTGHPDELAKAAERVEACAELEPWASEDGILNPAVVTLRSLERWARISLSMIEMYATLVQFDFESGELRPVPKDRRGPRGDFLNLLIKSAFEELEPELDGWTGKAVCEAVRDHLRDLLDPEQFEKLTDGKINGVIRRHTDKRR